MGCLSDAGIEAQDELSNGDSVVVMDESGAFEVDLDAQDDVSNGDSVVVIDENDAPDVALDTKDEFSSEGSPVLGDESDASDVDLELEEDHSDGDTVDSEPEDTLCGECSNPKIENEPNDRESWDGRSALCSTAQVPLHTHRVWSRISKSTSTRMTRNTALSNATTVRLCWRG